MTAIREASVVESRESTVMGRRFALAFQLPGAPPGFLLGEGDPPHFIVQRAVPRGSTKPQWSPRGDWIAFLQLQRGVGAEVLGRNSRLMAMRPDGTDLRTLHEGTMASEFIDFAWHPSGEKLIAARGGALFEVPVPPAPGKN